MTDTLTVEIPADVRDNSETVVDYANTGHRSHDNGVRTVGQRDKELAYADFYGYAHYQWYDVNQGNRQGWGAGHRGRFDVLVNRGGKIVHAFHTEYFTRVPCCTHDTRYATRYASVTDQDGVTTIATPYCDECMHHLRRSARESCMTVNESEPLLIGQHD